VTHEVPASRPVRRVQRELERVVGERRRDVDERHAVAEEHDVEPVDERRYVERADVATQ